MLSKNSAFPVKLHTKLKIETNMCTDVQRIFAAVGVLVGLLSAEDAKLVGHIVNFNFVCFQKSRAKK